MWWVPHGIEHRPAANVNAPYFPAPGDRIIFLGWEIDDNLAALSSPSFYLESETRQGHLSLHQLARWERQLHALVHDTMQYVRCPISTICIGQFPA